MDEILASIRKIIADDDEGHAPAPEAAAEMAPAHQDLTSDIAGAMGHEDSPGEPEDDIFDLTHQVDDPAAQQDPHAPQAGFAPPPPPVEPQQPPAEPFAAPHASASYPIPPVSNEAGLPPAPSFPEQPPAQPHEPPASFGGGVLSSAPMEEAALPESATGFGAAEPTNLQGDAAWQPGSAGEADAEAGGELTDLDSFAPGRTVGESDRVEQVFAESDVVAAGGTPHRHSEFDQAAGDAPMASADDAFAAAPEAVEATPEPALEAQDAVIVPTAPEPPFAEEAHAGAEEPEAVEEAAPQPAVSGQQSLEDSVKEMLRPLLREWLDDNMPRIVESAVRDELHNKHNQY